MLAPRHTASVGAPSTAALPGQPQGGNANGTNPQQDLLGAIKGMIRQSSAPTNYDPVYNNIYEDKTLQEFKAESSADSAEQVAYFRQHAAAWVLQFAQECRVYRHGPMYKLFRDVVENYPAYNHVDSFVKKEFIKVLLGRVDLLDVVATRTSIWFGYIMADIIRRSDGKPNRQQAMKAVETAALNILNLDIVLWLNGSRKAEAFLYNPGGDVADLINKFGKRKEAASVVFQFFEETSPYDAATFSADRSSEGNIGNFMPELVKAGYNQRITTDDKSGFHDMTGSFVPDVQDRYPAGDQELLRIAFDNVRRYQQAEQSVNIPAPQQARQDSYDDLNVYGNSQQFRTDLENITIDNRHQFDIRSYFTPTVCRDWYTIAENDWVLIKRVLPVGRIRAEDSLTKNCMRFVRYFFDQRDGEERYYLARAIRFTDEETKKMILSDPEKLLPHLDVDKFVNKTVVLPVVDSKEFFDEEGQKLGPDAEVYDKLRDAEFEYAVVNSNDSMQTDNTVKAIERMHVLGHTYGSEVTKPTAVISELTVTGRRLFDSRQKRDLIRRRFPMLFKGNEDNQDNSYFGIIESIARELVRSPVDSDDTAQGDRLDIFLANRLTTDLNNWFINACGYVFDPKDGNYLNVDNILIDLKELKEKLIRDDRVVYDILNKTGVASVVKSQIEIFDEPEEANAELSPIEREEHDMTLIRSRKYSSMVLCNDVGPKPRQNRCFMLRRSNNPEFYALIDTLSEQLRSAGRELATENILVMYKNSNDLFLVTPTVYDENVVSIRRVLVTRTFLNPAFG